VARRLSQLAFRTGATAVALVLAAPSAALADTEGHNPPGNNGTIKIDYPAPADSGHANRPHPGCAFQLRMFGFDDDQYGSVTFVGQAPTKLGTLLTQSHVLLSDDEAGGGQDVDAVYSYTAQQLGLLGTPQAHQGWHVKVAVDADDASGGAKQKVFWLSCPTASTSSMAGTTGTTGTTGGTAGSAAAATQNAVSTTSVSTGAVTSGASAPESDVSAGALPGAGRAAAARAAAGAGEAPTFTGGAARAATTETRGSVLPFTGYGLATAILVALAALIAGGLAIAAGRRRTTSAL
jgi:hypothetical protein